MSKYKTTRPDYNETHSGIVAALKSGHHIECYVKNNRDYAWSTTPATIIGIHPGGNSYISSSTVSQAVDVHTFAKPVLRRALLKDTRDLVESAMDHGFLPSHDGVWMNGEGHTFCDIFLSCEGDERYKIESEGTTCYDWMFEWVD